MKNEIKKSRKEEIFNSNLRLNLSKSEHKKAYDNLMNRDESLFPSYTTLIVAALNSFCESQGKDENKSNNDKLQEDNLALKIKESLLEVINEYKLQFSSQAKEISDNVNCNQQGILMTNEGDIDFDFLYRDDDEDD